MNAKRNSIIEEFSFHSQLILDLLKPLNNEDLLEQPVVKCGSFGKQFRHILDIRKSYFESLTSNILDYYRNDVNHALESDKDSLIMEHEKLNIQIVKTIESYNSEDFETRTIDGTLVLKYLGETYRVISPKQAITLLIEHEIFHEGELAIYYRATNRNFPKSWFIWGL